MAINPASVDNGAPETFDGRKYPEDLKAYEAYDDALLSILLRLKEATPAEIAAAVDDARLRLAVPRWMTSAEWRELIKRRGPAMGSPRTYRVSDRGLRQITA